MAVSRSATDAKVRSAKPRPESYKLVDANRLFLLVTPSGGKLWRWNCVNAGRIPGQRGGVKAGH